MVPVVKMVQLVVEKNSMSNIIWSISEFTYYVLRILITVRDEFFLNLFPKIRVQFIYMHRTYQSIFQKISRISLFLLSFFLIQEVQHYVY